MIKKTICNQCHPGWYETAIAEVKTNNPDFKLYGDVIGGYHNKWDTPCFIYESGDPIPNLVICMKCLQDIVDKNKE